MAGNFNYQFLTNFNYQFLTNIFPLRLIRLESSRGLLAPLSGCFLKKELLILTKPLFVAIVQVGLDLQQMA